MTERYIPLGEQIELLKAKGFTKEELAAMPVEKLGVLLAGINGYTVAGDKLVKVDPDVTATVDPDDGINWENSDAVMPDVVPTQVVDLSKSELLAQTDAMMTQALVETTVMAQAMKFLKPFINAGMAKMGL